MMFFVRRTGKPNKIKIIFQQYFRWVGYLEKWGVNYNYSSLKVVNKHVRRQGDLVRKEYKEKKKLKQKSRQKIKRKETKTNED